MSIKSSLCLVQIVGWARHAVGILSTEDINKKKIFRVVH